MISLIYNELLNKYNEILISTSRGFDTEYEFLESWVPSSDLTQSISDLINSAKDYNIYELEIILLKEEISELNFASLKEKFSHFATILMQENKIVMSAKNNE